MLTLEQARGGVFLPNWGFTINQILYLVTAIMFAAIGVQVTLFHYRQNFRHFSMWGPVLTAPVLAASALLLFLADTAWLRTLFTVLLVVAVLEGLLGFYYHFTGVGQRVGGYKLNNFLVGPPPVLPLTVSVAGLLGLVAVFWRP